MSSREKEGILTAQLRQAGRTACQIIDGKAVVITIDSNELHVFNPVATRVWELADGRALSDIVQQVVEEYEVSPSQATVDVVQFAEQLLQLGALEVQSSAPDKADAIDR